MARNERKPDKPQTYLNKKQEIFAKFLAEGCNQLDAYTNAGYEPSSANASTLANKPLVKARVEELKQQIAENELRFEAMKKEAAGAPEKIVEVAEWTFQRVMDMMADNVKLAQIAGEFKPANETLKMMAESMKMFEGAAAKAPDKSLTTPGSLTLIGRVVNEMGTANEEMAANPLAPRR